MRQAVFRHRPGLSAAQPRAGTCSAVRYPVAGAFRAYCRWRRRVVRPCQHSVPASARDANVPPDVPAGFLHSLFSVLGSLVLLKAAFGFFAGWGLLQREPWARMMTIVLSFLALFNVPFGTALGIYSLWVLLPAQSEREYELATRSAGVA